MGQERPGDLSDGWMALLCTTIGFVACRTMDAFSSSTGCPRIAFSNWSLGTAGTTPHATTNTATSVSAVPWIPATRIAGAKDEGLKSMDTSPAAEHCEESFLIRRFTLLTCKMLI